jgi:NADPH:quinone reductase
MRAAMYDRLGSADVLQVVDLPRPEPAPGEVRVRVRVSAVNPTDWKARADGPGKTMPFPFVVPNQDGAGEIDAVGDGVDPSRIDQRVWVYFASWRRQYGTAEEWVCLPAQQAVPLADTASLELGASLGIPALTAHRALFSDGPLQGKIVLVAGGAGAVGHFAIELARRAGARVLTTVSSPAKAELARAAGADTVVDYRAEDAISAVRAVAPDGVDHIVEVALGANLELDLGVLARNGTVVTYAESGPDPAIPIRRLMRRNLTLRFMLIYTVPPAALRTAVEEVNAAVTAGDLTELPVLRYGLDQIAQAHQAVEDGATGKVVVEL